MKKIRSILKSLQSSSGLNFLILIITALIGIFGQSILEQIAPPLFQKSNLPFIIFILTIAMYLASVTVWRSTQQQVTSTNNYMGTLANAIGHRVKIVSDAEGYKELQKRISNANAEILILTNYAFDWEHSKPIYDPIRMQSPERRAAYTAIQNKLKREKRSGFKFVRIVQIPNGHHLEEILPFDNIYREDCEFLAKIAAKEPEFASLRTSDVIFQNTFCVIDQRFLYLEFDISRPNSDQFFSPFVMLVDDPNSETMQELRKLHQRIEANTRLISHIDLRPAN